MLKMGKRNQLNILNIPDCEFPSDEKSAVMQTFLWKVCITAIWRLWVMFLLKNTQRIWAIMISRSGTPN